MRLRGEKLHFFAPPRRNSSRGSAWFVFEVGSVIKIRIFVLFGNRHGNVGASRARVKFFFFFFLSFSFIPGVPKREGVLFVLPARCSFLSDAAHFSRIVIGTLSVNVILFFRLLPRLRAVMSILVLTSRTQLSYLPNQPSLLTTCNQLTAVSPSRQ